MSRLVINKSDERIICIIRNFGSIELIGDTVKTIDKFGLVEYNIFDLAIQNGIRFTGFEISASNKYDVDSYNEIRYWNISNAALTEIRQLFRIYFFERLKLSIDQKEITLGDLVLSCNKNNHFNFKYGDIDITDALSMQQPASYQSNEIVLMGQHHLIHAIATHKVGFTLLHCTNDFPEYIFLLTLHPTQLGVLRNFINSCSNLTGPEDVFLLVRKS